MVTQLDVIPFQKPCTGVIELPGSKSISNRALLLSCFNKSAVTTLFNILKSEDVEIMIAALKSLGVKIKTNWAEKTLSIEGCAGIAPVKEQNIQVGNAGTVARFLTAWLLIQKNSSYHLDGTLEMRKRPIRQLLQCFTTGGIKIDYKIEDGHFPFSMKTENFHCEEWSIDASKSSQILSAVMMISPLLSNKGIINFTTGTVSRPFLEITRKMIKTFSGDERFKCDISDDRIEIFGSYSRKNNFKYEIEPDATAASYFLTLPQVVGGSCELTGIHENMLQGDVKYAQILKENGAEILRGSTGYISRNHGNNKLNGGEYNFNDISDTFLTLAAISPLMRNPLTIRGIEHTRNQECDRVDAMAKELTKLGQLVEQTPDSIHIIPDLNKLKRLASRKVIVETYEDHRVAMSFGILGSFNLLQNGKPWLTISDPMCCSKTFPEFFNVLSSIRES